MSHFILLDDNMEETLENLVSQQQEKLVIDDFMELFTSRSHMKEEYKTSYESARGFILEDMNLANYFLSKFKANLQTEIKLTNTKFR